MLMVVALRQMGLGSRIPWNWVLLNQECCTPKSTIRIRVSVLFSFVSVKSEFFLKFYRLSTFYEL
jgi:hypothetical protein